MSSFLIKYQKQLPMEKSIKVICEDTDVFVLPWHCYGLKNWEIDLYIVDFTEGKNIISIKDTVKKYKVLILGLLSEHAISGCDTAPIYYGIGKKRKLLMLPASWNLLAKWKLLRINICQNQEKLLLRFVVQKMRVLPRTSRYI